MNHKKYFTSIQYFLFWFLILSLFSLKRFSDCIPADIHYTDILAFYIDITLYVTTSYMDINWRVCNKVVTSKEIELKVTTLKNRHRQQRKNIRAGKMGYKEQLAINIDVIETVDSMANNLNFILSNKNPWKGDSIKNSQAKNKKSELINYRQLLFGDDANSKIRIQPINFY